MLSTPAVHIAAANKSNTTSRCQVRPLRHPVRQTRAETAHMPAPIIDNPKGKGPQAQAPSARATWMAPISKSPAMAWSVPCCSLNPRD